MKRTIMLPGGGRVVLMDSVSYVDAADARAVVVTGSHGGGSSARYVLTQPLRGVFFNDAGGGKDGAGIAGLVLLEAHGVAAAAVAHASARIGDAEDSWANGTLSAVNEPAAAAGLRAGMALQEAAALLAAGAAATSDTTASQASPQEPGSALTRFALHRLLAVALTPLPSTVVGWAPVGMLRSAVALRDAADVALCHELLWMAARDQLARSLPDPLLARLGLAFVDRPHTERMRAIVAAHGWPGRSLVGQMGAQAAWLLVQHADHDRSFQQRCLGLLAAAVAAGEAEPGHLAYLTDRVRVGLGQPQLYGTQMRGAGAPWPIEAPEQVDERRAAVGLEPLADYLARFRVIRSPK